MKKLVILLLLLFTLSGCGSDNKTNIGASNPHLATGYFMNNVVKGNYAEARKYLTDDANDMYSDDYFKWFEKSLKDEDNASVFLNSDKVKIMGNNATEPIEVTGYGLTETLYVVNLIKDNGWRISSISK